MKKTLSLATLMTGLIMFYGCHKPISVGESITPSNESINNGGFHKNLDKSVSGLFNEQNGMLFFKDAESFMHLDSVMHTENLSQQTEFANKLGFESLLIIDKRLNNSLESVTDIAQYNKLIDDNKDVIILNGDKIESKFDFTSAWALNRQGMVSIGGRIHCFFKEKTLTGSTVEEVDKALTKALSSKKVINSGARLQSQPCDIYVKGLSNPESTRGIELRVELRQRFISTGYDAQGETGNAQWYCNVQGSALTRNFFNTAWVSYSTDNHLKVTYRAHIIYTNPVTLQTLNFFRTVDKAEMHGYGTGLFDSEILLTVSGARNNPNNQYGWSFQASASSDHEYSPGRYYTTGVPAGLTIACQ